MIHLLASLTHPSRLTLPALTGATGAAVAAQFGLGAGLLIATGLGILAAIMNKDL